MHPILFVAALLLVAPLEAQPGRKAWPVGGGSHQVELDPCLFAPEATLKALCTNALDQALPKKYSRNGQHLTLSHPEVLSTECPNFGLSLRLKVRYQKTRGVPQFSVSGTARVAMKMQVVVIVRKPFTNPPHVLSARLCTKSLKLTGLNLRRVPNWVDGVVRQMVNQNLKASFCIDVTQLVRAYVRRGGKIPLTTSNGVLRPKGARSKFNLPRHGFKFVNSFQSKMVLKVPGVGNVNLASNRYGLCGGMIYAAHDSYYHESTTGRRTNTPRQTTIPPQGSRLRRYLWDRQVESLKRDNWWAVRRLLDWMARRQKKLNELSFKEFTEKIAPRINRGWAVPLLLVRTKWGQKGAFTLNHQVLAIGYRPNGSSWDIIVYDPNFPGRECLLHIGSRRESGGGTFRAFFVTKYRGQTPYWATQATAQPLTSKTKPVRPGRP